MIIIVALLALLASVRGQLTLRPGRAAEISLEIIADDVSQACENNLEDGIKYAAFIKRSSDMLMAKRNCEGWLSTLLGSWLYNDTGVYARCYRTLTNKTNFCSDPRDHCPFTGDDLHAVATIEISLNQDFHTRLHYNRIIQSAEQHTRQAEQIKKNYGDLFNQASDNLAVLSTISDTNAQKAVQQFTSLWGQAQDNANNVSKQHAEHAEQAKINHEKEFEQASRHYKSLIEQADELHAKSVRYIWAMTIFGHVPSLLCAWLNPSVLRFVWTAISAVFRACFRRRPAAPGPDTPEVDAPEVDIPEVNNSFQSQYTACQRKADYVALAESMGVASTGTVKQLRLVIVANLPVPF
jgi:effector-binding domain-containing protein